MKKKLDDPIVSITPECGTCKFWFEIPPVEDQVNECRRNAPSPGAGQSMAKWPLTQFSAWCGQWELK